MVGSQIHCIQRLVTVWAEFMVAYLLSTFEVASNSKVDPVVVPSHNLPVTDLVPMASSLSRVFHLPPCLLKEHLASSSVR